MSKQLVLTKVHHLTGLLTLDAKTPRDELRSFERTLARQLLANPDFTISGNRLSHESSATIDVTDEALAERFAHIDDLFESPTTAVDTTGPLIFRRETVFRSNLLGTSTPDWGTGMAASKTFGPFIDERGLTVWFDLFQHITLLSVFVKGSAAPALLIPVWGTVTGRRSYRIEAGSVWIASGLIARVSALDGFYTGLRVKGGTLELSQDASVSLAQIVIDFTTTAALHLDLDQQPAHAGAAAEAGFDATDSELHLPQTFDLNFAAQKSALNAGPASCSVFGTQARFQFAHAAAIWAAPISQILVPFTVTIDGNAPAEFSVQSSKSKLCTLSGSAPVNADSGWLLPATRIDPKQLGVAAGTGALCIGLSRGLQANWKGLKGGSTSLMRPAIIVDPDTVSVIDFLASNVHAKQRWTLWKNEHNAHHSDLTLRFGKVFPLVFISSRADSEALYCFCSHRAAFDRPLDGNGTPFKIESSLALAGLLQNGAKFSVLLFDNDLLVDDNFNNPEAFERRSLVLRNAFFNVSRPYSLFLSGDLSGESVVERGEVALTFAIALYLPTLADPYVATYTPFLRDSIAIGFGQLRKALTGFVKWPNPGAVGHAADGDESPDDPAYVYFKFANQDASQFASMAASRDFRTGVQTFHSTLPASSVAARADVQLPTATDAWTTRVFEPTADPRSGQSIESTVQREAVRASIAGLAANPMLSHLDNPTHQVEQTLASAARRLDGATAADSVFLATSNIGSKAPLASSRTHGRGYFGSDLFMLLDVSTCADQMGVSIGAALQVEQGQDGVATLSRAGALFGVSSPAVSGDLALQIMNMDVVAPAQNLRAVTLPQISWEPVWNIPLPIEGAPLLDDLITVAPGPVVYDNDGIPTRIFSESPYAVPIAPLPVTRHFIKEFNDHHVPRQLHSVFTLPFAMVAQADFTRSLYAPTASNARMHFNMPRFDKLRGGLQIKALAQESANPKKRSPELPGWTFQLDNIRWSLFGLPLPGSTLGNTVKGIFNNEFFAQATAKVPVERMEFSGYGASIFSNWLDGGADIAQVSQTQFDVLVGRTAHEVVQVRSILYPFAVHVVRTITLMRSPNGYVFRSDSGWKAEGSGFYDFDYEVNIDPDPVKVTNPYEFHTLPVKGVSNVREIRDFPDGGTFTSSFPLNDPDLPPDVFNMTIPQWQKLFKVNLKTDRLNVKMQAVVFDADVHLDNVVVGGTPDPVTGDVIVQSRKMIGYVQLEPAAVLVPSRVFADLLTFQNGSLGGPVDCTIDIALSKQRMRLARVDVNPALDNAGKHIFVTAARGSLLLPRDGSWSVVTQQTDTGDVKPVVEGQYVPLIKPNVSTNYRIGHPADAVRLDASKTHYGVLQSTGTQKLLFDVPQFTPGLAVMKSGDTYFADAYKLLNSKGIFPNIANALALTNAEKSVDILGEGLMRMAERPLDLGSLLPGSYQYAFVNEPGILKIYAEYKTTHEGVDTDGILKLGFDSTAAALADRWKAAQSDMRIVVDLGPFARLMWVDGNFNAASGAHPKYDKPNLQFGEVLDPVVNILRVLQALTGDDFDSGMNVGMSNSPDNWEYKFDCSKEIPVIKFPTPEELTIDPNPPLKLEAGLKVGFYFNEVLSIPSDLKQLVPACGAYVDFYGRLQVQCFTLAVASVYGVGQVNLGIAADSKAGVTVHMKFGFGAEVVVGLPVVANVAVLYMVEVEVSINSNQIVVAGLILFRGSAEICGGLVAVCIQIEAGGSVTWTPDATSLVAQVTFSIDVCLLWVIDLDFSETWQESRQIA